MPIAPPTDPASQVPRSVLDTRGLPFRQAHSLWQESIGALYDVRLIGGADENLSYRADAFHFGEVVLTYYQCGPQSFDRSRARIGRDGLDHITLQICVSGRHGPRDGGSEDDAGPGDMLIADLAQRQATAASDFSSLNLTVPRRLLAPLLKAPDAQNLRRIPGEMPLVVLLRNHLQGLYQAAPTMRREEAAAIVGPTLELAAAAVNAAVAEEKAAAVRMALTGEIRRHVEARIADPDLSAESVAAAFAMSTRKLYYLFEPHGGFTHYVQAQRLRRCRAELTDPAQRHESVAEIAERYGFTHRKSFIRAFRRAFEMTPREMRALAAEGRNLTLWQADAERHMWHWIRELR